MVGNYITCNAGVNVNVYNLSIILSAIPNGDETKAVPCLTQQGISKVDPLRNLEVCSVSCSNSGRMTNSLSLTNIDRFTPICC